MQNQLTLDITNYFQPAGESKGDTTEFLGTAELQFSYGTTSFMKVLVDIRKFKDSVGRVSVGVFAPYTKADGSKATKKYVAFASDKIEQDIVEKTKLWCTINKIEFGKIKK